MYSNTPPAPPRSEMVYGIQPVLELLQSDREIDRIFVLRESQNEPLNRIQQTCRERNIPLARVPQAKLDRFTRKNHQGVVALVSSISFASLDYVVSESYAKGEMPFLLVLDGITDVRNFGAIARTAECAGTNAVVVPFRGSAQMNADAMRTSAGALNHLPVCREADLRRTVKNLKSSGLRVVACTEKAKLSVFEADLTGPIALLMGAEDEGISPELLKLCDGQVHIPMMGMVGSLNVSVATGVVLFEVHRQREYEPLQE